MGYIVSIVICLLLPSLLSTRSFSRGNRRHLACQRGRRFSSFCVISPSAVHEPSDARRMLWKAAANPFLLASLPPVVGRPSGVLLPSSPPPPPPSYPLAYFCR